MDTTSIVKFCGDRFICLGEKGRLATSRDGVNWTEAKPGTDQVLVDVAFGHGWFVVIGRMGAVLRSRDGAEWEVQEHIAPPGTLTSMTFGGGVPDHTTVRGDSAWVGRETVRREAVDDRPALGRSCRPI
jgi:hypothetical protein